MKEQVQADFLRAKMTELREKYHKNLADMAKLLHCDKSTLSRVEKVGDSCRLRTVQYYAEEYCRALELSESDTEHFLRGEKVVVPDTSALLQNVQLIDELSQEYSIVVIPQTVVDELDHIKNHNTGGLSAKAWQILKSIGSSRNTETMQLEKAVQGNNDSKITAAARQAAKKYHCQVDLITNDAGFPARLRGDEAVHPLHIAAYFATKQDLADMETLEKLDSYYADSYDDAEAKLGIQLPAPRELNAYLHSGFTLIISAVRNRKVPLLQRTAKIRWLIAHGANVDGRDHARYHFPPLSHAVQVNDFEMFQFLLRDCHANPNVGSRNPQDSGKIQQKNDGNMPLMIAAWDNRIKFVKALCADPRTSLNQQDGNGFTALIKAAYWGHRLCMDILLRAGADPKIVDRDGFTAADRYQECLRTGRSKNTERKRPVHHQGGQKRCQ